MDKFFREIRVDFHETFPFLIIYLACATTDMVFGLLAAFRTKTLRSRTCGDGVCRKLMMLGMVLLATIFDGILPSLDVTVMGLPFKMTFAALACVWWTVQELISILENLGVAGIRLPKRLAQALSILEESFGGEDGHEPDRDPLPEPPKPKTRPKPKARVDKTE